MPLKEKDLEKIKRIREELEDLFDKRAEVEGDIKVCYVRLEAIQSRCDHPNKYQTSCMGETGWKCPTCGWST